MDVWFKDQKDYDLLIQENDFFFPWIAMYRKLQKNRWFSDTYALECILKFLFSRQPWKLFVFSHICVGKTTFFSVWVLGVICPPFYFVSFSPLHSLSHFFTLTTWYSILIIPFCIEEYSWLFFFVQQWFLSASFNAYRILP